MIQVSPDQVKPALASLFDPDVPASIRCFAVLAGGNAGKILTDDLDHPTWGAVWEAGDGTLYLGGSPNAQLVSSLISTRKQEGNALYGFKDGDRWVGLLPSDPDATATVLEFDRPCCSSNLGAYLDRLTDGHKLRRMGRALLERSLSYEDTICRYGSLDVLLDKGLAVCLMRGSQILCEAYADAGVMGVRELGVRTHEAYRGHGFATMTCAYLLKLCDESGCGAYWNCAKHNSASAAVARKLGFTNEREYQLVAWFGPK